MKTNKLISLALFFVIGLSHGQSGSLDLTFDEDGKVSTVFGNYNSAVKAIAVQPDGKIIAAGATFNNNSYHRYALTRYHSDGSIDPTFGNQGKVIGDFPGERMSLCSVIVQPDGKIIAAGIIYNDYFDSEFLMIRLNSDGSIDEDFGDEGMVTSTQINVSAIALQPDGKIVAAGLWYFNGNSNKDFLVTRFNTDGSRDTTFGNEGFVIHSVGVRDFGNSLALQPDGKILVGGAAYNGDQSDFCLLRLNSDGTLDSGFGENGVRTIHKNSNEEISSVKLQSDGKILFSGWSGTTTSYSYAVMRLLSDGTADSTFGTLGMISGTGSGMARTVDLQADGKILLAGAYEGGNSKTVALSRLLANGVPDTSFGENGLITTSVSNSCQANAVCIQTDGKILIGGEAGTTTGSYNPDFALMRYNAAPALATAGFDKGLFSVYPNPVSDVVNLQMDLRDSEILSIDLYDCNGRKIDALLKKTEFSIGKTTMQFQLPDSLSNGIYFLNISGSNTSTTVRILK